MNAPRLGLAVATLLSLALAGCDDDPRERSVATTQSADAATREETPGESDEALACVRLPSNGDARVGCVVSGDVRQTLVGAGLHGKVVELGDGRPFDVVIVNTSEAAIGVGDVDGYASYVLTAEEEAKLVAL